ncbi:hypothetical protein B0A49_10726 [Cryomyces minteri]|uniref:Uncharacterized protein n=1 Tax=Cryomyces minteri TaxID=331657 RepID=A0A4U0W8M3_9PEZI|nr:hypothetical protein B0A49_10726 [Cryomyces minteri]
MSEDKKRAQFYRTSPRKGEASTIKKDGVEAYRRKVGQYKEKEAVIIHLTSGQPARIPELFSLRFCNTVNGGQRKMSIEGGMVKFVASYHEGYNNSGNVKNIHRYLPREVGETFVYFVWLVDSFIRHLLFAVNGSEKKPGLVWIKELDGNKWTSTRFRKVIKRESMIGLGVALNIASYRQCAVTVADKWIDGEQFAGHRLLGYEEDDESNERDKPRREKPIDSIAKQTSHTAPVRGLVYGRGIEEAAQDVSTIIRDYRDASIQQRIAP